MKVRRSSRGTCMAKSALYRFDSALQLSVGMVWGARLPYNNNNQPSPEVPGLKTFTRYSSTHTVPDDNAVLR